jgi:hypothetical protein
VPLSVPNADASGVVGIDDRMVSPPIPLAGLPTGHAAVLSFDVYTDTPKEQNVFYTYNVRSKVGGYWRPWKGVTNYVYYDPAKAWKTSSVTLNPGILAGATDIQVGIDVVDLCSVFCEAFGFSNTCHSNGPLIDNVRVFEGNTNSANFPTTPVTVTFSGMTVPGETSLVTSTTGPAPHQFTLGNGIYYHLTTTAIFTNAQVCITYDPATLTVPEASLQLMHWDATLTTPAWVDITVSRDLVTHKICGLTTSLSPFAIGTPNATGVSDMPHAFALHQNVPNPFNPATTITYDVPAGGSKVSIRVYDATGHLVRTLVDANRPAGTESVTWDGRAEFGSAVSSGVYFYKMTAGSFAESKRMVLLK